MGHSDIQRGFPGPNAVLACLYAHALSVFRLASLSERYVFSEPCHLPFDNSCVSKKKHEIGKPGATYAFHVLGWNDGTKSSVLTFLRFSFGSSVFFAPNPAWLDEQRDEAVERGTSPVNYLFFASEGSDPSQSSIGCVNWCHPAAHCPNMAGICLNKEGAAANTSEPLWFCFLQRAVMWAFAESVSTFVSRHYFFTATCLISICDDLASDWLKSVLRFHKETKTKRQPMRACK